MQVSQNPELLDYCAANLKAIIYIGGDLPQDLGDRVASKVYLRCLWGATETGIVPQLLPSELLPSEASGRTLWKYVRFHPCVNAVFDKTADGFYEMVVRRGKNLTNVQPCFTVPGMQQLEEYRTKDLFGPHPNIPDLWCWRARADDIIVFLNGEKTNPISMEQHIIASNPEISGALVIGAQRFQAALLIEPASENALTTSEQAALIEHIWPSIEESNHSAPAHARVEKSFVLVIPADRRLIRSPKGTFMRGPSVKQYTKEIEELYANADVLSNDDDDSNEDPVLHNTPTGIDGATRLIRNHVRTITDWSGLDDEDNFFDLGMDSLQGLQLTRALRRSFHRPDFALSTVYQNPTVSQLAAAIVSPNQHGPDELEVMEVLLNTYREQIQKIAVSKKSTEVPNQVSEPINVLLTGSSGTIGSHLLHALLNRDDIARIFCLNRGEDGGKAAQYKAFAASGLSTTELDTRVTFIKTDLESPSLGLSDHVYNSLRTKIGLFIHAAWPVNFNLTLSSFRPQLTGLVNLLTLVASVTSSTVRFVFISSIAAVDNYTTGSAPEEVINNLNTPAPIGYGRAKFIAEHLVDTAGRHLEDSVSTTIIRVGQVAGPVLTPGLWNPREWLPSIVLSSFHLGQIPDTLGPRFDNVDFVPVDLLGNILGDLVTATASSSSGAATVFNLRNPHVVSWGTLVPAIVERKPLEIVTPAVWLASLRANSQEEDSDLMVKNPAVKLLDFLTGLWAGSINLDGRAVLGQQPMMVQRALSASLAMRELEAVKLEWMGKWIRDWIDFVERDGKN